VIFNLLCMTLTKYKEKRNFSDTPEPRGGKPSTTKLAFVVQKHQASHLHYDFRLEVRGVLLSWAIPKGPQKDPAVKRLAMLVEDHPYDYKDFEWIIPEGNYGAGTVIVWDRGYYTPFDHKTGKVVKMTKAEMEKQMTRDFHAGQIKIVLHGKKLKGKYALVRTKRGDDDSLKNWLLIKDKDEYASAKESPFNDRSVISGKSLEQMATSKTARRWQSNRKAAAADEEETEEAEIEEVDLKTILKKGKKVAMPVKVEPMLCTLTKAVDTNPDYLYEIKWDGYRIISFVNGRTVKMHSRSGLDYTAKYPPVAKALKDAGHKMVLDGEVVVFNEGGMPDFDALQKYNGHNTAISYCVFDLLWLDGYDLRQLPLMERKEILNQIVGDSDVLKFSESFDDGKGLYDLMVEKGLEGIVAKRRESEYMEGVRNNEWLKTPTRKRQEFVIGGYAESDKARSFRSLLFGAYNENGELEWIGRSGGGYKEAEMPDILAKLKRLETKESPFINKVLDTKGAVIHWVKPQLVANFEFATWTESGRIRKPATFLGFRKDKKAKDVVREVPKPVKEVEAENKRRVPRKTTPKKALKKKRST
jgi:bifunctional non-homologous end joining protein LigD